MDSRYDETNLELAVEHAIKVMAKSCHDELVDDIIDELSDEYVQPQRLGKKMLPPGANTIISYDRDTTTVLSSYQEDKWTFWNGQKYVTVHIRHANENAGFDLSGECADPLSEFYRISGFFTLPGNNPFSGTRTLDTAFTNLCGFNSLVGHLYSHGYLLSLGKAETKPLRLLTAPELKKVIYKRIAKGDTNVNVAGFYRAIARWLQLHDLVQLPYNFQPSFSIRDWQGDRKLAKAIATFVVEKVTPWEDIPHDDLMRLSREAQKYLTFAPDILFMSRVVNQCNAELTKGRKSFHIDIANVGITAPYFKELTDHVFMVDPATNEPWFRISASRKHLQPVAGHEKKTLNIDKRFIRKEMDHLIDCCIFLLLLWSGIRVKELVNIRTNGLLINKRRLDPADNAIEAFHANVTCKAPFELEFTHFKTTKERFGSLRTIPLAADAAHAFCILVEALRSHRDNIGNPYLLPSGLTSRGFKVKQKHHDVPTTPITIRSRFAALCKSVGADRHHPHKCRKTLATILINKNPQSLELIQQLLGHHSPTMTLRYLMSIPMIAEVVLQQVDEANRKALAELITAAASRRMSGKAGERIMNAIPVEKLVAEMLPDTIKEYIALLLEDPDFVILRSPAAWCLKFRTSRPEQLPCLPAIAIADEIVPDASNCRPWECGYAAHTKRHLRRAQRNRDSATRLASKTGIRAEIAESMTCQASYWKEVARHLEHGHDSFTESIPLNTFVTTKAT